MRVKVNVYDGSKYKPTSEIVNSAIYEIENYEVEYLPDEEIYKLGFDIVDENQEYLVLTFKDGNKATFRNSHCDMFSVNS